MPTTVKLTKSDEGVRVGVKYMSTMKNKLLPLLLLVVLFSSCRTALQFSSNVQRRPFEFGKEPMEFLGFKNSYTTDSEFLDKKPFFATFGNKIESYNIAVNRSDFYTGVYSFAEMERYHATKRYVSFIEVLKHKDVYNDRAGEKKGLMIAGAVIAGVTVFTLFPVYLPMLLCAEGNQCLLSLHGEYKLYVYDTQEKEIVYANLFRIDDEVLCKGAYTHRKTDHEAVREYTETIFFNGLRDEYERAYRYLENRQ